MRIDARQMPLFEVLLDIELEGTKYDLHNFFGCVNIVYSATERTCKLFFDHTESKLRIIFTFTNCELVKAELDFNETWDIPLCLDNLQRCRFEKDGTLHDLSNEGKAYMLIQFFGGLDLEFFCEEIVVEKIDPA